MWDKFDDGKKGGGSNNYIGTRSSNILRSSSDRVKNKKHAIFSRLCKLLVFIVDIKVLHTVYGDTLTIPNGCMAREVR